MAVFIWADFVNTCNKRKKHGDDTMHCAIFIFGHATDNLYIFDPRHDKTNKMSVHPAKIQISLGIRQSDQSLRCALNG